MKKFFISYYAVLMLILFIIRNVFFNHLIIEGLGYNYFMMIFLILNYFILIKFKKEIKLGNAVIILSFFLIVFSKDLLQLLLVLSNILILMVNGFSENKLSKILTFIFLGFTILLLLFIFICPIILLALVFYFGLQSGNDIYEDMHYYCENHVEVYAYSSGSMDKFHYSIGKYYDFIDIDDIIVISYHERNEKTRHEYDTYLKNHNCKLVGDINESK